MEFKAKKKKSEKLQKWLDTNMLLPPHFFQTRCSGGLDLTLCPCRKRSLRPCCVLSRLEAGALESRGSPACSFAAKTWVGKSCMRVSQVGRALPKPTALWGQGWTPEGMMGRCAEVHSPGLWVQLLLKMEPAISLSRKDQCGTKSLENILQNICWRCCCGCPGTEAESVGSFA